MKVIPPFAVTDTGAFTRASVGYYFDARGLLAAADINEPRWDYDPADLSAPPRPLVEPTYGNGLLWSEEFDRSEWVKLLTTVSPNAATGPDGNLSADTLIETIGTGNHQIGQAVTYTADTPHVSRIFAKLAVGTRRVMLIQTITANGFATCTFDLEAGTAGTATFGGTNPFISGVGGIVPLPNGWFLLSLIGTPGAVAGGGFSQIRLVDQSGSANYAGDGASGIHLFGAGFRIGGVVRSYIKSEGTNGVLATETNTCVMLTNAVETAPATWSGATTYSNGQSVSVAGSAGAITVYESLAGGNLNNAPASSPTWWADRGTTYQVYSGAATYALADRAISPTAHRVYESLAAGNVGNALSDVAKWLDVGPTNKWAMFDLYRDTATIVPSPLIVTLKPGVRIDAVAALGLAATRISVSVSDSSGTEVYTSSTDLNERYVSSWWEYFFAGFKTQPSFAAFDLPPYSGGSTTVVIENSTGEVECGALVVGVQEDLGRIQYAAESDTLNFSTVTRDFDGGTSTMVPRRNVPRTIQQVFADKSQINRIRAVKDSLNATPAVWAGLDDPGDGYFEALLILGFYTRFSINVAYPEHAILSLELEEI